MCINTGITRGYGLARLHCTSYATEQGDSMIKVKLPIILRYFLRECVPLIDLCGVWTPVNVNYHMILITTFILLETFQSDRPSSVEFKSI